MKRLLTVFVVMAVMSAIVAAMTVPAFAATPVVSDNASDKACFGQWRASTANGPLLASRGGDNAQHNVEDKAICAAQT
jgi:hypothetical protein